MRAHAQTCLDVLSPSVAVLRREARGHSDHLMTSSLSLLFKEVEERAPTGVVKALRERGVLHHPPHLQGFDPTTAVSRCIVLRRLAMEVASLATDLAVLTRPLALGLAPALTALLAAAHPPLRLRQPFLSFAVVARVLYPLAGRIGQEARQPHIQAKSRMRACHPLRMANALLVL